MVECCVEHSSDFKQEQQQMSEKYIPQSQSNSESVNPMPVQIPSHAPLLYSSFIEQSSQTFLNLCLYADQVVIAKDRFAKSTLLFDGLVKFAIIQETQGNFVHSKITFCKNKLQSTFLFLNSAEASLWYLKLLELGIPQLVQVAIPTSEQQNQYIEQQIQNKLVAKERETIATHTLKPSKFKYENLGLACPPSKVNNNRFNKTSGQIQSFLYKLILTKSIRNVPKQDAIVLQQVLL